MKYAALAAMLFASPALADDCEDVKRVISDYRVYASAMHAILEDCEGRETIACKLARKADEIVREDGPPITAGATVFLNPCP